MSERDASLSPRPLRLLLVDDGGPHIARLREELTRAGYEVLAVLDAALELAQRAAALDPDLIIIASDSPQRDTLEQIAATTQHSPRAIVLFTDDADPQRMRRAIRAGVSSYVVAGIDPKRLRPILDVALARFEEQAALRAQLQAAREALAARKRIERAKGILMRVRGLSEEAAYAEMRRLAMNRGLKLSEIADRIIEAHELLS
ncbi:MAG: ANTAR domain-containing protein [Burkholderiaceae bacterium]|nr:ANTAR domain-containing protein [Burkholderiaceae bacterium]MCX7902589.1 ANTAR domain-containing protein [Burkholderiaceae bacterium]